MPLCLEYTEGAVRHERMAIAIELERLVGQDQERLERQLAEALRKDDLHRAFLISRMLDAASQPK